MVKKSEDEKKNKKKKNEKKESEFLVKTKKLLSKLFSRIDLILIVLTLITTLCIGYLTLNYSFKSEHLLYNIKSIDVDKKENNIIDKHTLEIETISGYIADVKYIFFDSAGAMVIEDFTDYKKDNYNLINFMTKSSYIYRGTIPISITKNNQYKTGAYSFMLFISGNGENELVCCYNLFEKKDDSYIYHDESGYFDKTTFIQYKYNYKNKQDPLYEIVQKYEFIKENLNI